MGSRPVGRYAEPGDLQGPPDPPWPQACRRCGLKCDREGHPYGCPRTPGHSEIVGLAIRPCYCGEAVVLAPAWLAPCCEDAPPVRMPKPCGVCGGAECRVCDPDDEPVQLWEAGGWAHARCAR